MLALSSPRWEALRQAYGGASDVPRLLEALPTLADEESRAEIWFALWRMLYRPAVVPDAAYAAVPHLLVIGDAFPLHERVQAFHLVARIEIARRAPESARMPDDLVVAYANAMDDLPRRVADAAREPWTEEEARICAAALLAGKRQPEVARTLLEAGPDGRSELTY